MIYLFLILITLSFAVLSVRTRKNKNLSYFFAVLSCLPPILVSGLRSYSVGTDTDGTYWDIYIKSLDNLHGIRDKGYGYLNHFLRIIYDDFTLILIITSAIICGLFFYRIYKSSASPIYSIFLFFATDFYFISMNMIREMIVIAITSFAFPLINDDRKNSKIKYFLLTILATSMHTSGLLMIPLYFVCKYIKEIKSVIILLITVLNFLFSRIIYIYIFRLVSSFPYISRYFAKYFYLRYANVDFSWFGFLIDASILFLLCFFYKRGFPEYKNLILGYTVATNIMLYSGLLPLVHRVVMHFTFLFIIYFPNITTTIKNQTNRKIVLFSVAVGFMVYMIVTTYIQGQEEVLPYSSILFR